MKKIINVIFAILMLLIFKDLYLLIKGATFTYFGLATFIASVGISNCLYGYLKEGR